jgi:hypothetical protein
MIVYHIITLIYVVLTNIIAILNKITTTVPFIFSICQPTLQFFFF